MSLETITFRTHLIENMQAFLAPMSPTAAGYADFFAELIVSLAGHREEGVSLYPVVFVCDSLEGITDTLGGGSPIGIGSGPITHETVQLVLKQCSPLSERRQWAVYIHLDQAEQAANYGVFQTERSVLDPTILGTLRSMERDDLFLIGCTKQGDNVVEVRGANGHGLQFYLSGARVDARQPTEVLQAFVHAVSADADPDLIVPLRGFYIRVAADLTRGLHGSLIAVLPKADPRLDIFTDAIILDAPVAVPEAIRACLLHPGAKESYLLDAQSNLVRGMLGCDGITLFRSDGVVLGYNAFIQLNTESRPGLGGARRRAFSALAGYLGAGISLALYRSQDGTLDYADLEDE
ncbi:MAG TPA: hypothetical protein V6D23_01925 [Candidatus Obscuribacterales bacterium]